FRLDIENVPLINDAGRDVAASDQVAQPLRGIGVVFVVISARHHMSPDALKFGLKTHQRMRISTACSSVSAIAQGTPSRWQRARKPICGTERTPPGFFI